VAAGKGTVARLLANRLGILYVDTGGMYRALTLFIKQQGVSWEDEPAICRLIADLKPQVKLRNPQDGEKDGRLITVLLNDQDVSWQIRTEEISWGVSVITRYRCVRDYMLPQQQQLAREQSVVMEGRDIITRVLPQAQLKIYMTADEKTRGERRYKQLLEKGDNADLEAVLTQLKKRDHQDKSRENDPLVKAPGAWELDTTDLTIEGVAEKIISKIRQEKLLTEDDGQS
jgi:cytidylate kinase